ncbi:MAG TPA: hypothetical protein VM657_12110 [Sphingomonas sp.]|nr:hypothetical protein [Sphingomonas sp.]
MRAIISKLVTGTLIAGAALAVSACGDKTETTTDNTLVTDMNAMDDMGTMTDNMTAVDGTMGNDAMLANDTALANDTGAADAMANDTTANAM